MPLILPNVRYIHKKTHTNNKWSNIGINTAYDKSFIIDQLEIVAICQQIERILKRN